MINKDKIYDVAIVGGGASGLFVANCIKKLSSKNLSVVILEKNDRVGKKLLTTGNGRCNITNINASKSDYLTTSQSESYLIENTINSFSPKDIINHFLKIGVACSKADSEGRVYPNSNQASSVVEMLRLSNQFLNIEEQVLFEVKSVSKNKGVFSVVSSDNKDIKCSNVVLCTGSNSGLANTNANTGYNLAKGLGHSKTALFPSLVQIKSQESMCKGLKGMKCDAVATIIQNGKEVKSSKGKAKERGEFQFTEYGLTGIAVFQLSRLVSSYFIDGAKPKESLEISLDLLPDYTLSQVEQMLNERQQNLNEMPLENFFTGLFNKRIGQEVLKRVCNNIFKVNVCTLNNNDIKKLAYLVKNFVFPITGVMSFKNSQVTAGGVPLKEVDSAMQSKICKGLYFCGELLDVDGYCGGFNLQWAFSSAMAVSKNITVK